MLIIGQPFVWQVLWMDLCPSSCFGHSMTIALLSNVFWVTLWHVLVDMYGQISGTCLWTCILITLFSGCQDKGINDFVLKEHIGLGVLKSVCVCVQYTAGLNQCLIIKLYSLFWCCFCVCLPYDCVSLTINFWSHRVQVPISVLVCISVPTSLFISNKAGWLSSFFFLHECVKQNRWTN